VTSAWLAAGCCCCLQDQALALHPTGLPLTAKPLIDAGLLYDDDEDSP